MGSNITCDGEDVAYELICNHKYRLTKMELEQIIFQILYKYERSALIHHSKFMENADSQFVDTYSKMNGKPEFLSFEISKVNMQLTWNPTSKIGAILINLTDFDYVQKNNNNKPYTVNVFRQDSFAHAHVQSDCEIHIDVKSELKFTDFNASLKLLQLYMNHI